MSVIEQLDQTIESFYSAACGDTQWSKPLRQLTNLCGGVAATLELVDLKRRQSRLFQEFGIDQASIDDYTNHYQMIASRVRYIMRADSPDICVDYQSITEKEMDRDAFYADFLAPENMRYYISGRLTHSPNHFGLVSVQRSKNQGHVDTREIEIFNRVLPHVRRAVEFSQRLEGASEYSRQLEHALDHYADGVVLVLHDGSITQANSAAQEIFRRGDGLAMRRKRIEFADQSATAQFNLVLREFNRGLDQTQWPDTQFLTSRKVNRLPYAISMYPARTFTSAEKRPYLAIVFIHDLDHQRRLSTRRVQSVLGLTPMEAQLAVWIAGGSSLEDFAHNRDITMNTVYTHYRHLKEKAGCRSQATLVIKIRQIAS